MSQSYTITNARGKREPVTYQPRDDQIPPEGDWAVWTLCGDRGSGKTRAAAEWLVTEAASHATSRWAVINPDKQAADITLGTVAHVAQMAGLVNKYSRTMQYLRLNNGAIILGLTAQSPSALRGRTFNGALLDDVGRWADERVLTDLGISLRAEPGRIVSTVDDYTPPVIRALHGTHEGIKSIVKYR